MLARRTFIRFSFERCLFVVGRAQEAGGLWKIERHIEEIWMGKVLESRWISTMACIICTVVCNNIGTSSSSSSQSLPGFTKSFYGELEPPHLFFWLRSRHRVCDVDPTVLYHPTTGLVRSGCFSRQSQGTIHQCCQKTGIPFVRSLDTPSWCFVVDADRVLLGDDPDDGFVPFVSLFWLSRPRIQAKRSNITHVSALAFGVLRQSCFCSII